MKKVIIIVAIILVLLVAVILVKDKLINKDKDDTEKNGTEDLIIDDAPVYFFDSKEYTKIVKNKEHITSVKEVVNSEGEEITNSCDIDTAYNKIAKIKILQKTNKAVLDSSSYYIFEFDDNTTVRIDFEGSYLHYSGNNYEIEY